MPISRFQPGFNPPPPPPPPPPAPADQGQPGQPQHLTIDIPIPGHKGEVSQLSLPFVYSTGGSGTANPQQVLGGANGVKTTIGSTNSTLATAKKTKGALDALKKIKAGETNGERPDQVVKTKLEEAGDLSNSLKVAGGVGGAIGLVTNGINLDQGIHELQDGQYKDGGLKLASSGLGLVANVGSVAGGVVAGATLAKVSEESALMKGAGALSKTLGKISGPLTIASGGLQVVTALTKHPPDVKSAAWGGVVTAGGVAMCFPPVGTAIGGALVAGAMLVQNWHQIAHTAEGVAHIVEGTAEAAGHAIAHEAKKIGHDVANFFGL